MFTRIILLVALFSFFPNVHSAYMQEIYYVGMSCKKIQKDSIAYPSNEIFINTIVYDIRSGRTFNSKHPYGRSHYKNVKNGFLAAGPSKLIWRGKQKPLLLHVLMWEYDDGGKTIDVFSELLSNVIQAKLTSSLPPGQPVVEADKDPLTKLLSKGYRNLLGAENDLIGYTRVVIGKGDLTKKTLRRYGEIQYHYSARHTLGGADCRTFFRFKRGAYYQPKAKKSSRTERSKESGQQRPTQEPLQRSLQNSSQAQCRPAYDNCVESVQSCKSKVSHNNKKVLSCEKHGRQQHKQCVDYYLSTARNKSYSENQAKSLCRKKYDDYIRGCPRKMKDNCSGYNHCDNNYKQCVHITQQNQSQRARASSPTTVTPYPNTSYSNSRSSSSTQQKKYSRRMVTLSIDNQCPHVGSVALHYQTGKNTFTTNGWYDAPLNKINKVKVNVAGNDIYVHSSWGKVIDPLSRNIRKQLAIINKPFKYDAPSSLTDKKKQFVYFFPLALQNRSNISLILSCKKCMRCSR